MNAIAIGTRKSIRLPSGHEMAHRIGYEARNGYGYRYPTMLAITALLRHRLSPAIECPGFYPREEVIMLLNRYSCSSDSDIRECARRSLSRMQKDRTVKRGKRNEILEEYTEIRSDSAIQLINGYIEKYGKEADKTLHAIKHRDLIGNYKLCEALIDFLGDVYVCYGMNADGNDNDVGNQIQELIVFLASFVGGDV